MRLLEKQQIEKIKAVERKKEIDEGMKLAKTVDNLRKVKGEEETNLRKFRDQSFIAIKSEIDEKIIERDTLSKEVQLLQAKRLEAQAPKEQDLISREYVVNQKKDEIALESREILEKGIKLIERESTLEAKSNELFEREEKIKEIEALTNRYNLEAGKNYDITENLKLDTAKIREEVEIEAENRLKTLTERERDLSYKEHDILLAREAIENDKKDVEKEKLHIASQQETLRQAWISIKKLNNK